ncbi:g6280 [Coccomyxa elongata]
MAHKKLQDIPIEELRSKFGDSDDEDAEAASKAGALGQSEAALSGTTEVVSRNSDYTVQTFWEGDTDDEDEDSEADLDWVDEIEGLDLGEGVGAADTAGLPKQYRPNAQLGRGAMAHRTMQPRTSQLQRADRRLNAQMQTNQLDDALESLGGSQSMHSSVAATVRGTARQQATGADRTKDKADRATYQTVLDPRTRLVLVKMLNSGLFSELNGCVSTGKEANVYQAATEDGKDLAVKIYKTSILTFKDRDRYVSGDFRFKSYCKSNPRKMVKVWAEKEFRNLARMRAAGIRSPHPIHLRMHVLVMEFVGTNGIAAPRLKDAKVSQQQMQVFYTQLVLTVRQLYQECHLVHADLSEYNILVHNDELWIIDVSQSVDLDHPRAFDFLREDALHINDFFRRAGVATLTVRELFDFVVDPNINAGNIEAAVDALIKVASSRPAVQDPEDAMAEKIFHQAYIPRRLEEVDDYEADFERLGAAGGDGRAAEGIYYQTLAGMRPDMTGAAAAPAVVEAAARLPGAHAHPGSESGASHGEDFDLDARLRGAAQQSTAAVAEQHTSRAVVGAQQSLGGTAVHTNALSEQAGSASDDSSGSDEDSDSDEDAEGGDGGEDRPKRDPEADKAARKQHKAEVKETNRERRKHKLKKHVKKRAVNKHKHK